MRLRILVLLALVAISAPLPAAAVSAGGVISQVYGGGGNAQAAYSRDFVELFNRSKTAVSLTGWRLQYAPATSEHWVSTSLSGAIAPYRYFLVGLDGGTSGGTAVPVPDASGTTNLSRSAGKVRLLDGAGTVVDLVGYGSATRGSEGRPSASAHDNRQSLFRKRGGCSDSDVNATDFDVAAAKPRNRSAAANRCDSAPALNTVGNKAVHAGSQLDFILSAFDPDGDPLTYSASHLPSGATFYPQSRTFTWRPSSVGTYPGVTFTVSDGFSTDSETITIGVAPASESGPSAMTLYVSKNETEVTVHGTLSPDHRGFESVVRLMRRTRGVFEQVAVQRPILDSSSAFHVTFARATAGRCQIRARFNGDDLHDATMVAKDIRC